MGSGRPHTSTICGRTVAILICGSIGANRLTIKYECLWNHTSPRVEISHEVGERCFRLDECLVHAHDVLSNPPYVLIRHFRLAARAGKVGLRVSRIITQFRGSVLMNPI
jgi:hypothetical protein